MSGATALRSSSQASASFFASAIACGSSASLAVAARAGQKLLYLVRPLINEIHIEPLLSNIYLSGYPFHSGNHDRCCTGPSPCAASNRASPSAQKSIISGPELNRFLTPTCCGYLSEMDTQIYLFARERRMQGV